MHLNIKKSVRRIKKIFREFDELKEVNSIFGEVKKTNHKI